MSEVNIERLREAERRATPGEWVEIGATVNAPSQGAAVLVRIATTNDSFHPNRDAHFIALVRNALPGLMDALEAATELLRTVADGAEADNPQIAYMAWETALTLRAYRSAPEGGRA